MNHTPVMMKRLTVSTHISCLAGLRAGFAGTHICVPRKPVSADRISLTRDVPSVNIGKIGHIVWLYLPFMLLFHPQYDEAVTGQIF